MALIILKFSCILLVCLISGSLSQKNPDNYVILKNQAGTIEYKFIGNVEDFSQLHSPPLGPLSQHLGSDYCYKGVFTMYIGKNYSDNMQIYASREEVCSVASYRPFNSVRLLGSASSKIVHLFSEVITRGLPISYTVDVANITMPITNSLAVVGESVSATFYTLPNYGGASICVSVETNIARGILVTTQSFGFNTIRSFKFGCNSKKVLKPIE